jgi:hypothetical protein
VKGNGRGLIEGRYYSGIPGAIEDNHEELQSGQSVSGPRFEPGTSRIRSGNPDHTFGNIIKFVRICEYV